MDEIRGEKVVFGREDFQSLDAMPSASTEDAAVLATPRKRSWLRRIVKLGLVTIGFAVACLGLLFVGLENGYLDRTLTAQAETSLKAALGKDFSSRVGSVHLRFSHNWLLAFEASAVEIEHDPSKLVAFRSDSIKAVLSPMALMRGEVVISSVEIGSAEADLRFLPAQAPPDWKAFRIDAVPEMLKLVYPALDGAVDRLERSGTRSISGANVRLRLPVALPMGDTVVLEGLDFSDEGDDQYMLRSTVHFGRLNPDLSLMVTRVDGHVATADVIAANIATEPFIMKRSKVTGERRYGLDLPASLYLKAVRDTSLSMTIEAGEGDFYADSMIQKVTSGTALLNYDFSKRKIEISDGRIDVGATIVPFNGALADLDHVKPDAGKGFAFELVANEAVASTQASGEAPEPFNAAVSGHFLPETKELQLDRIGVSTASGTLAGTLSVAFVEPSPSVNFAARADSMGVTSIKQLWPFWFADKARDWVLANIKGGTVRNAEIDISLAAGRIPEHPEPVKFRDGEFRLAFDAEGAEMHYLGALPPARKTAGHLEMKDRQVAVRFSGGEITLPSGKLVKAEAGTFTIDDVLMKPLMGRIAITASGDASALVEYTTLPPLKLVSKMPFAAADLSGPVKGKMFAEIGLNPAHHPPPPVWNADFDLNGVTLAKPFENRMLSHIKGKLLVDPSSARLTGQADVDGLPFKMAVTEPLAKNSGKTREWKVEGNLSQAEVLKLAPSLGAYFSGSIGVSLESGKDGTQTGKLALTSSSLSIPVVNWRKGPGIKANASFTASVKEGVTRITGLDLVGDGFGAKGELVLDKAGLVTGKFSHVKLSPTDDFSVSLQRKNNGMIIHVSGKSIDARPFVSAIRSPDPEAKTPKNTNTVTAIIDRAVGDNKESLTAVNLKLIMAEGKIATLNFDGVTSSKQALVIRKDSEKGAMEITSGDAGSVARFADIYRNMEGGLLNITLRAKKNDSWRGKIDIRNFAIINEARLKSIVSARSGEDGRSLTDAVKAEIDTSSQKFRRGFASLMIDGKVIRIDNGLVRGDEVGATFRGTVRDGSGNTDLTGTFMPAYGINSLFGKLPLIGFILGNGRDRGLLGITFKLKGPVEAPKLTVNPLSLIAPGVFRNIFEFE